MTDLRPGTFTPRPGPAPVGRMLRAQTSFELRLLIRNGEQLLLALVIPIAALIGLSIITLIALPEPRVATVFAGVVVLAVLSTGFTSLAISTAFDRRYAVTKRLIGAGVPRRALLAGKSAAVGCVVAGQVVVLGVIAVLLGWRPTGVTLLALPIIGLGAAVFTGLGLLLGGLLKAELVLALANLLWIVQIALGGVVAPLTSAPGWLATLGAATPAGALSSALHAVLTAGTAPSAASLLVLLAWGVAGWAATLQWFKWQ
ncbi:MAG: ABC transporter permease [Nakamurella sp.]